MITRPWVSSTCTTRSPSMPSGPMRARCSFSPAIVLTGYRQISVTFIAAEGDPFTELRRIADETRADAVVVGASAHAGHRLVGSLAVRLVRAGRWPVTVVP